MALSSRSARRATVATALAVATAVSFGSAPSAHAAPPEPADPPSAEPGRYIVVLKGKPIATYAGEVKGLSATRPARGKRVNVTTKRAKLYRAYLERQQDLTAARVGAKADKHYAVSLNGFGTTLTADQARALRRAPGVLSVVKDTPRTLTDDKNPVDFLKLTGLRRRLVGARRQGRGRPGRRGRRDRLRDLAGERLVRRRAADVASDSRAPQVASALPRSARPSG